MYVYHIFYYLSFWLQNTIDDYMTVDIMINVTLTH